MLTPPCVDCCRGQPELQQTSSYSVDVTYHPTNGHPDNHSPNSSHLSVQSGDAANLVSRTQKQQTTQQVKTFLQQYIRYL
jgi:hypothetical protein